MIRIDIWNIEVHERFIINSLDKLNWYIDCDGCIKIVDILTVGCLRSLVPYLIVCTFSKNQCINHTQYFRNMRVIGDLRTQKKDRTTNRIYINSFDQQQWNIFNAKSSEGKSFHCSFCWYQLDMRARILNLVGIYGAAERMLWLVYEFYGGMTGMLSGTPCAGKQTKHEYLWRWCEKQSTSFGDYKHAKKTPVASLI